MEEKITEKQSSKLHFEFRDKGVTDADKLAMLKRFGVEHTNELSKIDASTLIDELMTKEKEAPQKMAEYKKDDTPQSNIIQCAKPVYEESGEITAIVPAQMGIVRPFVSPDQAVTAWKEYESLKQRIISSDDLQKIGDKEFIKKSGWRKLATCFNLSDEIVEESREANPDAFLWRIKVKVTAPNGRTSIGVGVCDSKERKFAHVEHDVYATAHTRAKSRAISDMIGAGAVSAEEMEN